MFTASVGTTLGIKLENVRTRCSHCSKILKNDFYQSANPERRFDPGNLSTIGQIGRLDNLITISPQKPNHDLKQLMFVAEQYADFKESIRIVLQYVLACNTYCITLFFKLLSLSPSAEGISCFENPY